MSLRIDTRSPECGWEPFVDWLRSQNLDPVNVRDIDIDEDTMHAKVTLYKRTPSGKRYLDRHGQVAAKTRTIPINSLPPRRTLTPEEDT